MRSGHSSRRRCRWTCFTGARSGDCSPGRVSLRTAKLVPDFTVKIAGDVPLPDDDVPLVGVAFRDASPKALSMQGAKLQWDFGDGQTSTLRNPNHVYLRPGLYRGEARDPPRRQDARNDQSRLRGPAAADLRRQAAHARRVSEGDRNLRSEDARRRVASADGAGAGGKGPGIGRPVCGRVAATAWPRQWRPAGRPSKMVRPPRGIKTS